MGKIILEGMKFYANIGTTEEERNKGNDITINLSFKCDTLTAGISDNLSDATDYSLGYQAVKAETLTPCNLIENLAYRIMQRLKNDFPKISGIELKLYKHYPKIEGGNLEKSGIELKS